jgi:hypothetical protein
LKETLATDKRCFFCSMVRTRGTNFAQTRRLGTYPKICQPLQKFHALLIAYLKKLMLSHVSQNHRLFFDGRPDRRSSSTNFGLL